MLNYYPIPTKLYGIDAAHTYLMRVGETPVQHRAVIRKQSLVNWIAAWLDYIEEHWFDDEDIILFSDREAKGMVVQQYDQTTPPVTMNATRLQKIVEFLVNRANWIDTNEWEVPEITVTRPKDYVRITIDEEDEYYSLSEAYWNILSSLNDLAHGSQIDYKHLEPVIGPCEPNICPETTINSIPEDDSVYRVFIWWQHNVDPIPEFSYETILAQIPALYETSKSDDIGPNFPDTSRRRKLGKVKALWTLVDDLGNQVELNAAEILFLLAKTLDHYYTPAQPETYEMLPSHVLPYGYYWFLRNGRFKLIFGEGNQLNWLDLGQRWSMKPAILQEAYR